MRRRHQLVGLVAITAIIVFTVYVVGGLAGRVSNDFPLTVTFGRVGQLLRVTGDVKLRGVIVGKIERIEHLSDGTARVRLALDPSYRIPAGISAAVRGKTLFGEKFVELIDPPDPASAGVLEPGDEIPIDRTIEPFELEEVLRTLQPVLDATSPGDLGGALNALAEGLAGQEEEARRTIDNALIVLRTLAENKDDLDRLLGGVDEGSDAFARAAPELIAALDDLDRVNQTLLANSGDLKAVLRDAPSWLEVAAELVEDRYRDLVDLSVKGADVLDLVASHRAGLPFAVESLKKFTQNWVTNLSTPCEDANGVTVDEKHPELEGSTCWQVWILSAERQKEPGAYGSEGPQPGSSAASAAYRAQLTQMMRLPFGQQPSGLALLLNAAVRNNRGLLPEELL